MWPFKRKPEAPSHKFGIGELVYLVDHPRWVNKANRHCIGRRALVVGLPGGRADEPRYEECYRTEVEGFGELYCIEATMRREPPQSDPFAEPRDLSDDTPNKVVKWDSVPLFKPTRETVK